MNRHHIVAAGLLIAISVLAYLSIGSSYDAQAMKLSAFRIVAWFLSVVFYVRLKSALEDDDIEADWQRINDGNIAVGIYRGFEFGTVAIAVAVLLTKI